MANHRKERKDARNLRVWQCVDAYTRHFGFAPSYHELETLVGCGTAAINESLARLIGEGKLKLAEGVTPTRALIVARRPPPNAEVVAAVKAHRLTEKLRKEPSLTERRTPVGKQRQGDILAFILDFKARHGVAPTLTEIAESVGCVKSVVRFHLLRLQEQGILNAYAFIPRGIVIVKGKQHA